ncbi:unnamed protein product [Closterium sp. Naga37s-1]|nr:unnamed protein product [Closterium sp. Naga37s-1]
MTNARFFSGDFSSVAPVGSARPQVARATGSGRAESQGSGEGAGLERKTRGSRGGSAKRRKAGKPGVGGWDGAISVLGALEIYSGEGTTSEEEEEEAEEEDETEEETDEEEEYEEEDEEEEEGGEEDEEEEGSEGEGGESEEKGSDEAKGEGCGHADVGTGDSEDTQIPTPWGPVDLECMPGWMISALEDYEEGQEEEEEAEEEEEEEEEEEGEEGGGEEGGAGEAGANQPTAARTTKTNAEGRSGKKSPFSSFPSHAMRCCDDPGYQQRAAARREKAKQEALERLVFQLGLMAELGLIKPLTISTEQLLANWGLSQAHVDAWDEEMGRKRKDRGGGASGGAPGGMGVGGSGGSVGAGEGVGGAGEGVGGGEGNAAGEGSGNKRKIGQAGILVGEENRSALKRFHDRVEEMVDLEWNDPTAFANGRNYADAVKDNERWGNTPRNTGFRIGRCLDPFAPLKPGEMLPEHLRTDLTPGDLRRRREELFGLQGFDWGAFREEAEEEVRRKGEEEERRKAEGERVEREEVEGEEASEGGGEAGTAGEGPDWAALSARASAVMARAREVGKRMEGGGGVGGSGAGGGFGVEE